MYVRLGFSIAINVDPDILLVDEVLAVGDTEFQRKCIEKVDELKRGGRTIVIVSHALASVRNLCDTVALLEHGELRRVGPAADVVDQYLGETYAERTSDGVQGMRWGTGEIRVKRMELLDASGEPVKRVRTGDTVVFRFHYRTDKPTRQPVFGMAIHSVEGHQVTGPNTREAGLVPDRVDGEGYIDLRIDRLLLVPGTYDLSGSVYDFTCTHAYDHRHRAFRFDVEHGDPREEYGLVSLGGTWTGAALGRNISTFGKAAETGSS
jgi:ABC-2 type transport system ATP-binding protein